MVGRYVSLCRWVCGCHLGLVLRVPVQPIFRTVALEQHWCLSVVCSADALHLNNIIFKDYGKRCI